MLEIISVNANGLGDDSKRRDVFWYYKRLNVDVIMVQETHSSAETQALWKSQWGSEAIFSHGQTNARGVMILFRKSANYSIGKTTIDKEGRFIVCDCKVNNQEILLVNVYAPNEDKPSFFIELFEAISKHTTANRIIGGDFNLVLDVQADSKYRATNNTKACKLLNSYMEESQLVDIWRTRNENAARYTHFKVKGKHCYARLDYFIINYGLVVQVQKAEILPSYKSDHSMISVQILEHDKQQRGRGYWKLNNSIFNDIENVNKMNEVISKAEQNAKNNTPHARWEHVKDQCIQKSKQISKEQAE